MIHHVYANQSNIGDWLSALGIQSLLAPRKVVEHFCDEPFVPGTLAALGEAGPDDLIIIGGGGLFMDYFTPFWEGFRLIAARVPFVIWGVGCCEHKRDYSLPPRALIAGLVRRSRICVVRDELTREFLRECPLPPPVLCPTVAAVPNAAGETRRLLHVDHYDHVGAENYERMVALAEEFARRTGRSCRQANNRIPGSNRNALQKLMDLYASADLILTSRLHACIIGLAMGRRVLVVSGDRKVESFMSAAGLSEWVCSLDQMESLPARLDRLPEQRLPVEFVKQGRSENKRIAKQVIATLSSAATGKSTR